MGRQREKSCRLVPIGSGKAPREAIRHLRYDDDDVPIAMSHFPQCLTQSPKSCSNGVGDAGVGDAGVGDAGNAAHAPGTAPNAANAPGTAANAANAAKDEHGKGLQLASFSHSSCY